MEQVNAPGFPRYRLTSLSACLTLAATSDVITLAPLSVARRSASRGLGFHELENLSLQLRLALFTLARASLSPSVLAFQTSAQRALLNAQVG